MNKTIQITGETLSDPVTDARRPERMQRGVRLALLAPEMLSPGGVQSFMWRIWDCMAGLAADPSCLSLSVLNDGAKALRASGRVADSASVVGGRRSKARFVTSVLRQHAADAMIVGHIGQSPVAWILKKLGRVRAYAVVLHGNEAWKRLSFFQRLACRDAFCVIATTQFTARRFVECNAVPRALLRIAPLCADESSTPASNFVLTGDFRILIVGRQWKSERYKGFSQLIAAVALMHASGRHATLHVVGEGDDQPSLRKLAEERGVISHVLFHGVIADADLAAAYQTCHVYAMPSGQEGFGIAFLEAMRYARPCVGAIAGGIPEVIDDEVTGLLVPYGDEGKLAEALCRLYDDPELRDRLGAAGLEKVRTTLSYQAFCSTYRALLWEMVRGLDADTRETEAEKPTTCTI
jgi:phosphatidyl-myo-inositol dimannoside synthase